MIIAGSRDFSPLSSGAGRLFDAVAALIGACDRNTFEGEAAMVLESLTADGIDDEYVVEVRQANKGTIVDFYPAMSGIVRDMSQGLSRERISTKFHNSVATVIRTVARKIRERTGIADIALSGGTFQNQYLLKRAARALSRDGMKVYANHMMPCSDAGISLGQAYLVRERLRKRGT
jgi:hydrogenase maturation protein HypF